MAVIDMDSHLRDGYFLDEIYDLQGEFAALRPKKLNDPEGYPGNRVRPRLHPVILSPRLDLLHQDQLARRRHPRAMEGELRRCVGELGFKAACSRNFPTPTS